MSNKQNGTGKAAQASSYKLQKRQESNRKLKLERALKRNPNNKQIEAALKDIRYRRKTPKTQVWSHTTIEIAKLFKLFKGVVHKEIFHTDEKISGPAKALHGSHPVIKFVDKDMFQLRTRAHFRGELVWK